MSAAREAQRLLAAFEEHITNARISELVTEARKFGEWSTETAFLVERGAKFTTIGLDKFMDSTVHYVISYFIGDMGPEAVLKVAVIAEASTRTHGFSGTQRRDVVMGALNIVLACMIVRASAELDKSPECSNPPRGAMWN